MKLSDEFRDPALVREIASRLQRFSGMSATIMEVCGTHTMSVARFGLKSLMPEGVRLISGPGCPVCVTDQGDIDCYLALGMQPGVTLACFGDMMRVPGSVTSLERLRAEGADVRVVYSPMDAVEIARAEPDKEVVFFGVGFETTMPAVALAIKVAAEERADNFLVYCAHKTIPEALRALLASNVVNISGLLLPGHVTAIIGSSAYDFIASELGVTCAVAGFEPVDILLAVEAILTRLAHGTPAIDNMYPRAVQTEANPRAAELMAEVFVPCDASWRGLGSIAGSGVTIAHNYAVHDAKKRFQSALADVPPPRPTTCRCGDVLRGVMHPSECLHFGRTCNPTEPIGPCMVSSEGACAAAYRYEGA